MPRPVALIVVPFHMGLQNSAVGAGPNRLLEAGADRVLAYGGRPAEVEHMRLRDAECQDIDAVVDVGRQLRVSVRQAREQEMLPVVLAGNCNSCVAILAGLEPLETGIVWLDAHPDFHTPSTIIRVSDSADFSISIAGVDYVEGELLMKNSARQILSLPESRS